MSTSNKESYNAQNAIFYDPFKHPENYRILNNTINLILYLNHDNEFNLNMVKKEFDKMGVFCSTKERVDLLTEYAVTLNDITTIWSRSEIKNNFQLASLFYNTKSELNNDEYIFQLTQQYYSYLDDYNSGELSKESLEDYLIYAEDDVLDTIEEKDNYSTAHEENINRYIDENQKKLQQSDNDYIEKSISKFKSAILEFCYKHSMTKEEYKQFLNAIYTNCLNREIEQYNKKERVNYTYMFRMAINATIYELLNHVYTACIEANEKGERREKFFNDYMTRHINSKISTLYK